MPSAWIVTRSGLTRQGRLAGWLAVAILVASPVGARASGAEPETSHPCPTAETCRQRTDSFTSPAAVLLAQASLGCIHPTFALHIPTIVADIVAKHLNLDEDTVITGRPYRDLGMDDLDQIEIVMDLESQFDMEIDDEDAVRATQSFPDTIAYLRSRQCR